LALDLEEVDTVLSTHLHIDHGGELPAFFNARALTRTDPSRTDGAGLLAISLDSPQTKIVDEEGLVVEEIAMHHGDCPSVAYRISYQGVVVVFSGDRDASGCRI
jgi:ribonuclease BN (tRNA processing enzyme)